MIINNKTALCLLDVCVGTVLANLFYVQLVFQLVVKN